MVRLIRGLFLTLIIVVSGCGGGDGGTSTATTPQTSFSVSDTALSVSAPLNWTTASTSFSVTVQNIPDAGLYYKLSHSVNAIASGGVSGYATSSGLQVSISFASPQTLGTGTFADVLYVYLCYDSTCTNTVNGSPKRVDITLTVTAPNASLYSNYSSITDSAFVTYQYPEEQYISANVNGSNGATGSLTAVSTNNAIDYITNNVGSGVISITIHMKIASELGPGTYQDTVTISGCWDAACRYPLVNSPLSIPVTYTVSNTVPGTNGYAVNLVRGVLANAIAMDSVSGNLFAVTTGDSPTYPNSLIKINPATHTVTTSVTTGTEATILKLTDDGTQAYIGFATASQVKRYATDTLTLNQTISLGLSAGSGSPLFAKDIEIAPSQTSMIAVAKNTQYSTPTEIGIYNNTTLAASSSNIVASDLVWGGNSGSLFISDGQGKLTSATISGKAITEQFSANSITSYGGIRYHGGLIYTDQGVVYDPAAQSQVGQFSDPNQNGLFGATIDSQNNRAFFLSGYSNTYLYAYNLSTLATLRTTLLEGVYGSTFRPQPYRFGTNGLAFIDGTHRIILVSGAMISN